MIITSWNDCEDQMRLSRHLLRTDSMLGTVLTLAHIKKRQNSSCPHSTGRDSI